MSEVSLVPHNHVVLQSMSIYNNIGVKYKTDKKIMKYTSVACLIRFTKHSKHIL